MSTTKALMDKDSVIDALRALTNGMGNRTKISMVREVFPYIEAAKHAGLKNAKIVETLNAQGFALTVKSFEMLLYRIREQHKAELKKPGTAATIPSSVATPEKGSQQTHPSFAPVTHPASAESLTAEEEQGPALDELASLDKKQRRERLGDQFIKDDSINPLLKRIKDQHK